MHRQSLAETEGVVHLWYAPLDLDDSLSVQLTQLLSPDERQRAGEFVFDRDRRRYAVGRGVVRLVLSCYIGITPETLMFSYGPRGKPMLDPPGGLHFNVSHSEDRLLVGATAIGPLGVDIEHRRVLRDLDRIVEDTFSPSELDAFRGLDPAQRVDAFYRGWTCKEAFVKTSGDGLAIPLDWFDVAVAPHEDVRITGINDALGCTSQWTMFHLRPNARYDVAVCVNGRAEGVKQWEIDAGEVRLALGSH